MHIVALEFTDETVLAQQPDKRLLPLLGNVKHHDDSITVLVHIQEFCIQGHLIWLQHTYSD